MFGNSRHTLKVEANGSTSNSKRTRLPMYALAVSRWGAYFHSLASARQTVLFARQVRALDALRGCDRCNRLIMRAHLRYSGSHRVTYYWPSHIQSIKVLSCNIMSYPQLTVNTKADIAGALSGAAPLAKGRLLMAKYDHPLGLCQV
jgi:hypothetical protein